MNEVNHIGIAVNDIEQSINYYTNTLGLTLLAIEDVITQQVRVAFLDAGNVKLELLQPLSEKSAVAKFLKKRGEGVHHIAFGVTDIRLRMRELEEKGVQLLQSEPSIGAGGAEVAFLHPKSSYGVLYELCENDSKGD